MTGPIGQPAANRFAGAPLVEARTTPNPPVTDRAASHATLLRPTCRPLPMQPTPAIRPATLDDLPALLPLFRAYQAHYGQLTAVSEAQTRAFLADHLRRSDGGFVLMAWSGEVAVGFAAVYFTVSGLIAERLAHLGDLYVVPDRRYQGLGTSLFDSVSMEARRQGIRLVRWLSLSSNTELNRWYNRLVKSSGSFELFLRPTGADVVPSQP